MTRGSATLNDVVLQTNATEYLFLDQSSDTNEKDRLYHVQNQDEYNAKSG